MLRNGRAAWTSLAGGATIGDIWITWISQSHVRVFRPVCSKLNAHLWVLVGGPLMGMSYLPPS
jgi:hypothetical protein